MKIISKQAKIDGQQVQILQDKNSTDRERQRAFEKLYSNHSRQLNFYFNRQINDEDTAEDLKMITFEKVYNNINTYDSNRVVFSTWLYKIALNTLIDYKRKDKFEVLSLNSLARKNYDDNDEMEFEILSDALTPEQIMVRNQNIDVIRQAIDSIENESIRKLMTYRFIDDLSFNEISKLEGVEKNCSTLRVNARKGQILIKKLLLK